jgi:hypothetical protein
MRSFPLYPDGLQKFNYEINSKGLIHYGDNYIA